MPTAKLLTLGRERTVATLARKMFQIDDGPNARLLQRKAEAAILKANPRLRTREGFRTGARIVVPAVTGLRLAAEVSRTDTSGDGLTNEAALRLAAAGSRFADAFSRAAEERKETLARVEDREFVAEARRALRQSGPFLTGAAQRLRREEREAQEIAERMEKAVSLATEAIEQLESIAKQVTPRS